MRLRYLLSITAALIVTVGGCTCDPRLGFGCVESNFRLAPESRLPRWFSLPDGYSRDEVSVDIDLYSSLVDKDVKTILKKRAPDFKTLSVKIGTIRKHPVIVNKIDPEVGIPNYSIITVDGIEEVFEQRRKDDVLYISDDPKFTNALKQK